MTPKILCPKCGELAEVLRLVSNPGELLAVGRTLGLMEPAAPYFIFDCPKCGRRVVDKSESKQSESTS